MIAALFILPLALLLLIQVAVTDTLDALRTIAREVNASFNHDTQIFPDHTNQ